MGWHLPVKAPGRQALALFVFASRAENPSKAAVRASPGAAGHSTKETPEHAFVKVLDGVLRILPRSAAMALWAKQGAQIPVTLVT